MSDLIDRSAVLQYLCSGCSLKDCGETPACGTPCNDYTVIKDLPAVDAVPVVHAKWTEDGECTRCGCTAEYTEYATERYDYDWDENLVPCGIEYHRTYHTTDYCPTCGARMDGEDNAAD